MKEKMSNNEEEKEGEKEDEIQIQALKQHFWVRVSR